MHPDLEKLPALKNLTQDVKQKALEFADALGARGPRPTTVLGTAVTLAQEWKSGRLPTKQGGPAVLVQPRNGRWIIRRADSEHATHMFMVREDAVRRAQEVARRFGTACFVFGPGGTLIERYEAPGTGPTALSEAPAPAPVPVPVPAPVSVLPIPEATPEPIAAAEPDVTASAAPPLELELAPATTTLATEPVVETLAPVVTLEAPVVSAESVVTDAPEVEPEPEVLLDPEGDPIRVKKLAHKWSVIIGDGRTESFATRQKAQKRAKDLGRALGRAVVML